MASQVRRFRQAKRWSIRRLAQECAQLGMPSLTDDSLRNIERGQEAGAKRARRRILVEELVTLARALNVPPVLLVVPLGVEPAIELLPGQPGHPWQALKWFTGRGPFPGDDTTRWATEDAAVIELFQMHEDHVFDWYWERDRPLVDPDQADEEIAKRDQKIREAVDGLVSLRREMRARWGIAPPPLLPDIMAAIGEQPFVVYGRTDPSGRIVERRTVPVGSPEDHAYAAQRPVWRWLNLPFTEPPADFIRDETPGDE